MEDNIKQKKTIKWNVELWKWYFTYNKNMLIDKEKEKLFNIMVSASGEDIKLFMRFFLYVANTRSYYNEVDYKMMCFFISLLYPDMLIGNIDHVIRLGKRSDILYFMPNIHDKVIKWLKHKVKEDPTFEELMSGNVIEEKIKRVVRYKPKNTSSYKWAFFFTKLASDTTFNGLQTGTDFEVLEDYISSIQNS